LKGDEIELKLKTGKEGTQRRNPRSRSNRSKGTGKENQGGWKVRFAIVETRREKLWFADSNLSP